MQFKLTNSQNKRVSEIRNSGYDVSEVRVGHPGQARVFSRRGGIYFRHDIGRRGRVSGPVVRNPEALDDPDALFGLLKGALLGSSE